MEQKFFGGQKGEPIIKRLEKLHTTEPSEFAAEELPAKEHGVKHEVYALSAYLIQKSHQAAMQYLAENPEEVKVLLERVLLKAKILNAEEIAMVTDHTNQDEFLASEALDKLSDQSLAQLLLADKGIPSIYSLAFEKALRARSQSGELRDRAAHARLVDLLRRSGFRKYTVMSYDFGPDPQIAETFIMRGAVTATGESWGILVSLVLKYNKEFKTALQPADLVQLASSIKKVLIRVASMHLVDFDNFSGLRFSQMKEMPQPFSWEKAIRFVGSPGDLQVSIDEEFFAQRPEYEKEDIDKECRQGCPARDAKSLDADDKKESVLTEVFDFYQDIAIKVLLPHQARLVRLAEEKLEKTMPHV